jgi:hypothetical protein
MNKVFVLSLFRTGTQSTQQFLEDLGYRTAHYGGEYIDYWTLKAMSEKQAMSRLESIEEQFDAFTDIPYHSMFEYFDNKYPGSKFILITRDIDGWIKSVNKIYSFFENKEFNRFEEFVYKKYLKQIPKDRSECTDEVLTELYNSHIFAVSEYFSGRTDLLTLNLYDQDKERKIIDFLGITDTSLTNTKMQNLDFMKGVTPEVWQNYLNQINKEKDFIKYLKS